MTVPSQLVKNAHYFVDVYPFAINIDSFLCPGQKRNIEDPQKIHNGFWTGKIHDLRDN